MASLTKLFEEENRRKAFEASSRTSEITKQVTPEAMGQAYEAAPAYGTTPLQFATDPNLARAHEDAKRREVLNQFPGTSQYLTLAPVEHVALFGKSLDELMELDKAAQFLRADPLERTARQVAENSAFSSTAVTRGLTQSGLALKAEKEVWAALPAVKKLRQTSERTAGYLVVENMLESGAPISEQALAAALLPKMDPDAPAPVDDAAMSQDELDQQLVAPELSGVLSNVAGPDMTNPVLQELLEYASKSTEERAAIRDAVGPELLKDNEVVALAVKLVAEYTTLSGAISQGKHVSELGDTDEFLTWAGELIGASAPEMLLLMGTAMVTGGAGLVAAGTGTHYSHIQKQAFESGKDISDPKIMAEIGAAAIGSAALELIGTPGRVQGLSPALRNVMGEAAAKKLETALTSRASQYAQTIGGNGIGEAANELGQAVLYELAAGDITKMTWDDVIDNVVGGLALGSTFSGVEVIAQERHRRSVERAAAAAPTETATITAINKAAAGLSAAQAASPEAVTSFLQSQKLDRQDIHIAPEELQAAMEAHQLTPDAFGVTQAQIDAAVESGNRVAIQADRYVAAVAQTPDVGTAFEEHGTTTADGFSAAEMKDVRTLTDAIEVDIAATRAEETAQQERRRKVYEHRFGQLVEAGRAPMNAKVETLAQMAFFETMAKRIGATDGGAALYDQFLLRIEGPPQLVGRAPGDVGGAVPGVRPPDASGTVLDQPPLEHLVPVLEAIQSGASPQDIVSLPAVQEALVAMLAIAPTMTKGSLPSDGSVATEALADRQYVAADGRTLQGFEEVVTEAEAVSATYAGPDGVVQGFRADIILGPPAAGKSMIADPIALENGARLVDSDDVKKLIPEFQGGIGANAVHEESSYLAKVVAYRAILRGDNLVIPTVGDNLENMQRRIQDLKEAGYQVNIVNMSISVEETFRRMMGRFVSNGRLVHPDYVLEVGNKPQSVYDTLRKEGLADGYAEFNNEVPKGQAPTRILDTRAAPVRGAQQRSDAGNDGRGSGLGPDAGGAGVPQRTLNQSAVDLQSQPLKITGTGPHGRILNWDLAVALTERHMAVYGRALDPVGSTEDFATVVASAQREYLNQLEEQDSGNGWYVEDIANAIETTIRIIPELADPLQRDIFLTMAALLSPQQKPLHNWENAILAMQGYLKTGKIVTKKPSGKNFGVASHTTGLLMFGHLIEKLGPAGALEWVRTPKTGLQMAELRQETGLFTEKDNISRNLPPEMSQKESKLGIYMMGPKVGDFMLNATGIDPAAITVDLWLARTYNRLIGRLLDVPPKSAAAKQIASELRGKEERNNVKDVIRALAAENGIDPSAMQAALWYFEQRLYRNHGIQADSQNFSGAAEAAARKRGIDPAGEAQARVLRQDQPRSSKPTQGAPGEGVGRGGAGAPEGGMGEDGRPGKYEALPGAPRGVGGPIPDLVDAAENYAASIGLPYDRQSEYVQVDTAFAGRIASAYDAMKHDPSDPKVKEAYEDLARQTMAQYQTLVDAGYSFTFFGNDSDPYATSPVAAVRDLRETKSMAVYATAAGYGVGSVVNIGLADPAGGKDLDPQEVLKAIGAVGEVVESNVHTSDSEPTLVVKLKGKLDGKVADELARSLGQEAMAQRFDDETGVLHGPKAEAWSPYNPAFFLMPDGRRAADVSNPLLADTGVRWKDQDGVEQPVLFNDLFRAVHDAFGHGLEGAGFRAQGEENAWQAHSRLFHGPALAALTTETRGQNSWLNYGPYGESNRTAGLFDTVFAEQKIGLLPEWAWTENRAGPRTAPERVAIDDLQVSTAGVAVAERAGEGVTSGPVTVTITPDGKPFLLDGYHRLRDAKARGETDIAVTYRDFSEVAILYEDAVSRGELSGGRVLNQDDTGPRGQIELPVGGVDMGTTIIRLFETQDPSTFWHESGHFYLEIMQHLSGAVYATADGLEEAPQQMRDDMAAINEWLGRRPDDDSVFTTAQQEQWAEGFEAYVMEGKSPSAALTSVFSSMRKWMLQVYKALGGLQVTVPPEIKEIMDRMLATDEEIAAAKQDSRAQNLFTEQTAAGMTDAEWQAYQNLAQKTDDEAARRTYAKAMEAITRRKTKEWKAQRTDTLAEVRAELEQTPVYRLISAVGNSDAPRLSKQQIIDQFGKEALTSIDRTRLGGKRAVYGDDGVELRLIAELYGFRSAGDLVATLQETRKLDDAVEIETDKRMTERYGDPLTDGSIEEEAQAALHNPVQAERLGAEIEALEKQTPQQPGTRPPNRRERLNAAYRARAEEVVSSMPVRQVLKYSAFLRAERKHAREAEQALAKVVRNADGRPSRGSMKLLEEAKAAKKRQLLNHHLYRNARERAQRFERARRKMLTYRKNSVRQNIGAQFMDQIDALLEQYSFQRATQKAIREAETLNQFVQQMIADGRETELAIPDDVLNRAAKRHYTSLDASELEGVLNAIANIEHLGRKTTKMIAEDEQRTRDQILDEIITTANTKLKTKKLQREAALRPTLTRAIKNFFNLVLNADSVLRALDAFQNLGPAWTSIKSRIDLGNARLQERREDTAIFLRDQLYGKYYSRAEQRAKRTTKKVYPELGGAELSGWGLISMALNSGNRGNWDRLTNVDGIGTFPEDGVKQVLLRELTEKDWRFVQDVWDYLGSFWGEVSEHERATTGVTPKKVQPVFMAEGPDFLTGGYFPIVYDNDMTSVAEDKQAAEASLGMVAGKFGKAMTANGHTKARVGSTALPLRLDMAIIHQHVYQVLQDLELRKPILDSWKLVTSDRFRQLLRDKGMSEEQENLELWLQDTAGGDAVNAQGAFALLRHLRGGYTMSKLALNFSTAAIQTLGLTHSAVVVGRTAMLRGTYSFLGKPQWWASQVAGKSPFMRERQRTMETSMNQVTQELGKGPALGSHYQAFMQFMVPVSFFAMQKMQYYTVDLPTWVSAYEQAQREGKSEEQAVMAANHLVRRAQGSGLMADRGMLERGTIGRRIRKHELTRIFTVLGSYMFAKFNITHERVQQTNFLSPGDVASLAVDIVLLYGVEAIAMALLRGQFPGEDDEEELPAWMLKQMAYTAMGTMPIAREVASNMQGYGGGTAIGGYLDTLLKAGGSVSGAAFGDEEFDKRDLKNISNGIGALTGLPSTFVNRTVDALTEDDLSIGDQKLRRLLDAHLGRRLDN